MKLIALCCVTVLFAGCARFSTTQKDIRHADGKTEVVTKAAGYTLFSSTSSLASWKATQSEATQNAEVGDLRQQGATNTEAALSAAADLIRAVQGK